jgi:uncharacterized 2Fe-2S/4Fe-4S cluster protein (DUF4445 family)
MAAIVSVGFHPYALAVDVGTTNVEVALVEVGTRRVQAVARRANGQSVWGSDVLSRLQASLEGQRKGLRDAVQDSILVAIGESIVAAGLKAEAIVPRIGKVVIAANTVMAILATGADGSSMATTPFAAPHSLVLDAGPLRDALPPDCEIEVLKPLAHFVGGDLRAALIALDLTQNGSTADAVVDLGTNAELALRCGADLYVSSAAAGPAFSGGGERMLPSVLFSDLAWLLREGALASDGLLLRGHAAVGEAASGVAYGRAPSGFALSQLLVREIQMAKAAVQLAFEALVQAAGLRAVDRLTVSGAFGDALQASDMFELHFFGGTPIKELRGTGDLALAGAVRRALGARAEIEGTVHAVSLTALPDFQQRLLAATAL